MDLPQYTQRALTCVAGEAQSLPPGRTFMVLSASVDQDALGIAVGDANGDFTDWPSGVTLQFDEPTKISLISRTNQTIVVLVSSGELALDDDRQPVTQIAGSSTIDISGAAIASGVVVAANSNTKGIRVLFAYGAAANNVKFSITGGNRMVFALWTPTAGTNDKAPFTMPREAFIEPGVALNWASLTANAYASIITYKVLT